MDPQELYDAVEVAKHAKGVRRLPVIFSPIDFAQPTGLVMREPASLIPRQDPTSTSSGSSSTCTDGDNSAACAKPTGATSLTVPIVLGITIPILGITIALIYLHRRHVRKVKQEDLNDRHASLDFGLGEVHRKGGKGGATVGGAEYGLEEKHARQLSMDMVSPYLLPPELQNSRESLHSLSRNIINKEDPYRPVAQYYNDNASMRSMKMPRGGASSVYTGSSDTPSRFQESSTADLLGNAANMPRSGPPAAFVPPPRQNSLPQYSSPTSPVRGSDDRLPFSTGLTSSPQAPEIQMPQPVARKGLAGLPTNPRPGNGAPSGLAPSTESQPEARESYMGSDAAALRHSNNYLGAFIHREDSPAAPPAPSKSPVPAAVPQLSEMPAEVPAQVQRSPESIKSLPANPRPERKALPLPVAQEATIQDGSDYGDGFMVTPPSPGREEQMRGQRYSMDVPPEEFANAGLGAPGFDPKRLSMGFRPLPPNAATEHDDPEVRANRIRSFYKEYFDDSKPAPQGQYYEDYDENYLGDSSVAYFDPDTNNFVMPYAQPVTRRAMTPPPQGQRFMGQGPPRAFHGSMGGSSLRGPPPMMGPGPRSYSSASGRMPPPGPRAQSSASNRGPPRGRPMPPPAALTTLPTPSKLRDDNFAIFAAADFAPPPTYQDRQAGRSQSPLGERRPYSPALPAYKPLVTSFDDLAPMPSPHVLRKSGTFTALDFAPPRKFRDPENASDAGSIRSNRSGVSQMTNNAIRNGAYRVSRIPQDMVFSKDDIANQLKPTWAQRQGAADVTPMR